MKNTKVFILAKKAKASEESTNFFKTYTKLSPKIKKIKKEEDKDLLATIVKNMNTLLDNLS